MKKTTIGRYDVSLISGNPNRICYVLIPVTGLDSWFTEASSKYGLSIAIVSNMDWDNDLTPWPASGEPPGSPDFEGKAKVFQSVRRDTAAIVEYLKEGGIDIGFEMVPGNHYQHLEQRLNRSLDWIFGH